MSGLDFQTGLYLLLAAVLGGSVGSLMRGRKGSRRLDQLGDKWQTRFDVAIRQKEKLSTENISLKSSGESGSA